MESRRVLITGSRNWRDALAVYKVLTAERQIAEQQGVSLTVVHGKCRTGADLSAHNWCVSQWTGGIKVIEDPFPPDPNHPQGPKRANLDRNTAMAKSGVVVCHAFPLEGGTGTRHCMSRSFAAKVPVENHGYQPYTTQARDFAEAYG